MTEPLAPQAELPLRYLRQHAHYAAPVADGELAVKAVRRGFAPVERILARHGLTPAELADELEVPPRAVEDLLGCDPRAPLVMLDGEDAQVLDEAAIVAGRQVAARVFREEDWGTALRFYRPSGLELPYWRQDLETVLTTAGEGLEPRDFPVDGIVVPKLAEPGEVDRVSELLDRVEERLGLPAGEIRLAILVESAWGVANLAEIVRRSLPRLVGLIFGSADYSADLVLPKIRNDHPMCDWARSVIVNLAAAAGVPAIDGMTLDYPVADPGLTEAENRRRILARLRRCYEDARHAIGLGMKGKWAGHPAQLFVVLLAFRVHCAGLDVAAEIDKLSAYRNAVERGVGATIIDGVMSDRATDRHARARLREAVAVGRLSPQRGLELGVVGAEELEDLRG